MIHGICVSAWGAVANQLRLDTTANNIANQDTPGFRPDWTALRSYRNFDEQRGEWPDRRARLLWTVGGGGMVAETRTAHRPGPIHYTGNPTDLALAGDDTFFAVEREGQVRYTRAGNFQVSADGRLVTADGAWQVLGEGGGPLRVGGGDFVVGRDGEVTNPRTGEGLGRVRVVRFESPHRLEKVGLALFAAPESAPPEPTAGTEAGVQQGALETSGTNAAQAMIRLIEAQRAYDMNMQMLRAHDQMLNRAVTDIARLGG